MTKAKELDWTVECPDMTIVNLPERGKCLEDIVQWLDEHTSGDYLITPYYVGFEIETEATLFRLGFA